MEEKIQTVLKVSPKLKHLFKRLAQDDGRTMAGEFEWLVIREAKRRQSAKNSERK